jgi:Protein of unknown function (DUF2934)
MNRPGPRSQAIDDGELERLLQLAAALHRAQQKAAARPAASPAHGEIARRAYLLYLERGGGDGRELEDWLRAERELAGAAQ